MITKEIMFQNSCAQLYYLEFILDVGMIYWLSSDEGEVWVSRMMSDTASEVSLSESLLALDTMTTADVDFDQTDAQDHQTMDSDLETLL